MGKYLKYLKRKWAGISFVRPIQVQPGQAVVSFTFDDAPVSAFTNGGAILSRSGFAGTFYIALSFMTGKEAENRFTLQDLEQALNENHELGCHTSGHIDLSSTPLAESIRDIASNQEKIKQLIPGFRFRNFSYPFGAQTRSIKKYLSSHFRSARGIGHGLNAGETDLYNLKTVKLYEKRHSLPEIFARIGEAEEKKAWLIFYTHDVTANYTDYGCSPAYFKAVVEECAKRKLTVRTIDGALDLIESK